MVEPSGRYAPDKPTKSNVIKYPVTDKVTDKSATQSSKTCSRINPVGINSSKIRRVPDTNLTLSTLVCLCFNLPLGVIAMYLSLTAAKAYRDGKNDKGDCRANASVLISLFSIVSTVLIVMSIVLWIAVDAQSKAELRDDTWRIILDRLVLAYFRVQTRSVVSWLQKDQIGIILLSMDGFLLSRNYL